MSKINVPCKNNNPINCFSAQPTKDNPGFSTSIVCSVVITRDTASAASTGERAGDSCGGASSVSGRSSSVDSDNEPSARVNSTQTIVVLMLG